VRAFTAPAGIAVTASDISVAARILGEFPEFLTDEQKVPDNLAELGRLTLLPDTNIIKLPNISASVQQLQAAIKELQGKGYDPRLPRSPPKTDAEKKIRRATPSAWAAPSTRCCAKATRTAARRWRSRTTRARTRIRWASGARPRDPRGHDEARRLLSRREVDDAGQGARRAHGAGHQGRQDHVLKPKVSLQAGEIIDSMFMSKKALLEFYEERDGRRAQDRRDVLAARQGHDDEGLAPDRVRPRRAHLLQGGLREARQAVRRAGRQRQQRHGHAVRQDRTLPTSKRDEIIRDLHACHEHRPELAMVDSAKGITNLHAPNDVIVDASMPAMIRIGGKMWGADGRPKDTKAVIPESTFARIYQEVINFCKTNGNFDPVTMGTVPNVGLMAQQAEEYGSHDKTFEVPRPARRASSTSPPAKCC
jgi:isocitrate dehydrogenase